MLNYTQLTMGKLVEEVVFRLTQFRNEVNTDYFTIAHLANHAVNEIMTKSLPYKDWAYISTINVANGTLLPREFLKEIRVMLFGATKNIEARYSTPMELSNVTDTFYGVSQNTAYLIQPIYTLWGQIESAPTYTPSQLFIYLRPITMTGIIDCYVAPQFNYSENYLIPIPYEFEESVISGTLFRALQRIGLNKEANIVYSMIEQERIKALELLKAKKQTEVMNLDSFDLPVPPNAPVPPPFNPPKRR